MVRRRVLHRATNCGPAFALALWFIIGGLATAQDRPLSGLEAAAAIEQAVVDAVAKAEKSVVAIARVRRDTQANEQASDRALPGLESLEATHDPTDPGFIPHEFGSGVVIDAKGMILTNYHVLGDLKTADYYVWISRKPYLAKVKSADPWLDVAVLQIEADNLRPATLGNARDLKKGQFVIALGNPYAIARDGQPSVTWGVVSNLSRQAPSPRTGTRPSESRETLHHWGTLIQTDVKLELGSSGGALLNLKGEMIGLTTSYAALAGYERPGGFAIPVDDEFRKALDVLKVGRLPDYGFLGIAPETLAAAERRRGKSGAKVLDVVPATPAAIAGILPGDVVTHIDGQQVHDDLELIRRISAMQAESVVSFTLERGTAENKPGRLISRKVTLSKKRQEGSRVPFAEKPDPTWRGLRVDYATAAPLFREHSRDLDPAGCVGVIDVERDSPAWKAGLRPGDFISHVGEGRAATPNRFFELATAIDGDVTLLLSGTESPISRTVSP